jgi:hypothetical protein
MDILSVEDVEIPHVIFKANLAVSFVIGAKFLEKLSLIVSYQETLVKYKFWDVETDWILHLSSEIGHRLEEGVRLHANL